MLGIGSLIIQQVIRNKKMKKMILLSAVPGAGKSTWAEKYKKNHLNTFIVSSDEIRKELGGSYKYFAEEEKVWKLFIERANSYLNFPLDNLTVILDSTLMNDYYREYYLKKTSGFDFHSLVFIDVPFDVAKERNVERIEDKVVPEEVLIRMYHDFERPSDRVISLFDSYQIIKI